MESFFEPDADLLAAAVSNPVAEPEPVSDRDRQPLEDAFPSDMHEDLQGLMWVGYLSTAFDYLGHKFQIKTLTIGEELMVAQVVKDYNDTFGVEKAMAAGLVAACVELVDGQQIKGALGHNAQITIRDKFQYITDPDEGWYWPTIEAIYTEFVKLQARQAAVYDRMQAKS